jgi:glutamate racemase
VTGVHENRFIMDNLHTTTYQYAFLDSGTGGLPYFAQLRAHAPHASCVYLADTRHFPYGEKTRDEVIRFATATVDELLEKFSPEVVIVACNTISVAALAALRERYSIPFVGTVPAIKLGAAKSVNRKIGLLATERTVCDPYTDDLIGQFASDCEVTRIGDSKLVSRIESELVTAGREARIEAVKPSIERFRAAGVDTIVLACTHFLHVSDEIREVAGPDITIIDSREGVVQQALRLVPPRAHDTGAAALYISGGISAEMKDRYQTYAKIFDMKWGGII